MTPYQFGQKLAAELPKKLISTNRQPMEQALTSQAKMFPHMVNLARASGQNQSKAIPAFEEAVRARTGEYPSNWEITDALMQPNAGFSQVPSLTNK